MKSSWPPTTRARFVFWPSTSSPCTAFARQGISGTIVFFGSARLDPNGPLGRYYEDARTLARC